MISQSELPSSIENFIKQDGFPCVGAKIALNKEQIVTLDFGDISSKQNNQNILDELYQFIRIYNSSKPLYFSFVATFKNSTLTSEKEFEDALWDKLQNLYDRDSMTHTWDKRVSDNPNDSEFSFSLGGEAFFMIGLSPFAKRRARRFKHPSIVFNLHSQFQVLKETNKFSPLRDRIRTNEEVFSGSANPNLHDHGVLSEARQYSGRAVSNSWKCPFSTRKKDD
jgi:FPC/CPF motif-containing protein YcgG